MNSRCYFFSFIILVMGCNSLMAQRKLNQEEQEFVTLVNQARTNPAGFLQTHKELPEKFKKTLRNSKPLTLIQVSEALCQVAGQAASGNLNPQLPSMFCGASAGTGSGVVSIIDRVADYANNIMSPDYTHVGVSLTGKGNDVKFSVYWSRECSFTPTRYHFSFSGKIDSSTVDFKKINTAADAKWMTWAERQMVKEINFARCYPKIYADIVEYTLTEEGKHWNGVNYDDYSAGTELLEELRSAQPLNPLLPSECIYAAAKAHGQDELKRGFTGHQGSDGSWPWERIEKKCTDIGEGNENLVGGGAGTPRSGVIQLLVDGGISSRGHRYNTVNPKWTHVACYLVGKVGSMPSCWVQNYGAKK